MDGNLVSAVGAEERHATGPEFSPSECGLVVLVGGNPLPSYISAATLRPSRVHLVWSDATRHPATRLADALRECGLCVGGAPFDSGGEPPLRNPGDPCATYDAVKGYLSGLEKEHTLLDYTGGTKVMAVQARLALDRRWGHDDSSTGARSSDSFALYVDGASGQIRFDDGCVQQPAEDVLDLERVLGLHGLEPEEPPDQSQSELVAPTEKVIQNAEFDVTRDVWAKRPAAAKKRFADLVVIRHGRVHCIRCGTDARNALYEGAVSARQLGGDLARFALVCNAPAPNAPREQDGPASSKTLERAISEVWDAPHAPRVFGKADREEWEAARHACDTSLVQWLGGCSDGDSGEAAAAAMSGGVARNDQVPPEPEARDHDLIILVGSSPIPNYQVVRTLKPKRVLAVHTPQTKEVAERLDKRLKERLGTECEIDRVSVSDGASATSVRGAIPASSAALNYTGGTKVMAAQARIRSGDARNASYLDFGRTGTPEIRFDSCAKSKPVTIEDSELLEDVLELHRHPGGAFTEHCRVGGDMAEKALEEGKRTLGSGTLPSDGEWFEQFVAALIWKASDGAAAVSANLRGWFTDGGTRISDAEIDVVAVYRGRLFLVSCKTKPVDPTTKEQRTRWSKRRRTAIYEGAARARWLAGGLGSFALAYYERNANRTARMDDILAEELRAGWEHPGAAPRVFGPSTFKDDDKGAVSVRGAASIFCDWIHPR